MTQKLVMQRASELLSLIKTLPVRHHDILRKQLNSVLKQFKLKQDSEEAMKKLDYRFKFLKLAFPELKPVESDPQQLNEVEFIYQEGGFKEIKTEVPGPELYHIDEGELVRGAAPVQSHNDLMNWFADNADPEDLNRHRKLLARMNFRGEHWPEGRPKSVMQGGYSTVVQGDETSIPGLPDVRGEFKQVDR